MSVQQMVDLAHVIFAKQPILQHDLCLWNRKPVADCTWPNMRDHFHEAQANLIYLPTAGDPRDVSLSRDSKLSICGWVLEMDQKEAEARLGTIMEKCHPGARLTLVPFMNISAWDTNGASTEMFFIKQNQMLCTSQVLNINGLKGLEEFTTSAPGEQITLQEAFLEAKDAQKQPIFSNISQGNSKRVCFLTTKDNYHDTLEVIDDFIETFVPALLSPEDQDKCLFNGQEPIRVGKCAVPKTISTYTSHLTEFSLDLYNETRSVLSLPPPRRTQGQRSYVDVTKTTSDSITQPIDLQTTASTKSKTASIGLSVTNLEAKLHAAMEKITTLNVKIHTNQSKLDDQSEASGSQMQKLEDSVLKSFESIINLAKQQDSPQRSISETTNECLGVLSTLLTALVVKETVATAGGPASPIRKNRKTNNSGATEPAPGERVSYGSGN
jgi:hypothetical protein